MSRSYIQQRDLFTCCSWPSRKRNFGKCRTFPEKNRALPWYVVHRVPFGVKFHSPELARAQVFTAACRMLWRTQWLLCVLADKHSHTGPCLGNNGEANRLLHSAFISCNNSGLHWSAPPDQETLHRDHDFQKPTLYGSERLA